MAAITPDQRPCRDRPEFHVICPQVQICVHDRQEHHMLAACGCLDAVVLPRHKLHRELVWKSKVVHKDVDVWAAVHIHAVQVRVPDTLQTR